MKEKYRYEIRQIDAWATDETDDGFPLWSWNESWHICEFESAAENIGRMFLRKIHALGIYFTAKVKVVYDGSIYEIQRCDNDEPLFALLPID